MKLTVNRGDMWIVNLEPGFGRELHKKRPALIISANLTNHQTANVIIVPASSQVPIAIGAEMVPIGKKGGADKNSVLMPIFIRSIDQDRLIKKLGKLDSTKIHEVEEAIKLVLNLS